MNATLPLPSELTLATLPRLLESLRAQASAVLRQTAPGQPLVLEASALRKVDTAGLAALLQLRRMAMAQGCGWRVLQPPPALLALARLSSAETLIGEVA